MNSVNSRNRGPAVSSPQNRTEIAVIGAGRVGQALGGRWRSLGYQVRYGVPDPTDERYSPLGAGQVALPSEVARNADVIVLAIPWEAAQAACGLLGTVAGKIVIDCTNPVAMGPDGLTHALGLASSAAEHIRDWCKGAYVFKTLNQTGFETMADPTRQAVKPVMFVAGDDAKNKEVVLGLVDALGFEAADAGPLTNARWLEAYALIWIDQVFKRGQSRSLAFALSRSKPD
jgi:8-hydroxy-5-deazaflavin:NADPH oxidoreductase